MNDEARDKVGPVLRAGPVADAVLAAIRELNADVDVRDRGSYVRVSVPWRCTVTREAIARRLGTPFSLPSDLEAIMPSFKGRLTMSTHEVTWTLTRPEPAP